MAPDVPGVSGGDAAGWLGRTCEHTVEVTGAMVDAFAELTGDRHPLHTDAAFARARGFPDRLAHGLLLGGLVSEMVGMRLPGGPALLQDVHLSFRAPCRPGTAVTIRAEVVEHVASVSVVRLAVTLHAADGTLLAKGTVQCGLAEAP